MVLFHNSETEQEVEEIGYLEDKNSSWNWVNNKFQFVSKDIVNAFDSDKKGNIWMAGGSGVYIYNDKYNLDLRSDYPIYISNVKLLDSVYHNYILQDTNMNLSYGFDNNFIRFEVAAPSFHGTRGNEYRFQLIGLTDSWSDWSKNNWIEFNKIPEGTYTFQAQARNEYGILSRVISFGFVVHPPWYRSWIAYLGYFLGSVLLMIVIIRLSIRRIKNQNIRLEAIVQERTTEIANKNDELEEQKAEIEEKNNDIMSSIKYAERLQKAILPPPEKISKTFP